MSEPKESGQQSSIHSSAHEPKSGWSILVVDPTLQSVHTLIEAVGQNQTRILQARSAREAQDILNKEKIDLAVVADRLPDATANELVAGIRELASYASTVIVSPDPSVDQTIEAMRLGVADIIRDPLDIEQANMAVRRVLAQRKQDRKLRQRVKRLKRVCRKLSAARAEVSNQVNVLCNDVVTAYQELAEQIQNVESTSEYATIIGNELDLERLLRETLEYLLKKAGPTNAAVFLPATMDEFSLGGYINYDWSTGSPEMLLQHLGDVVAPRVAEHPGIMHLTDNQSLQECFGDDASYLEDCHIMGTTCVHEDEPLAVLVLFRDNAEPFPKAMEEIVHAVSEELADYLHRIIRVHHRHLPDLEDEADDEDGFDLAA